MMRKGDPSVFWQKSNTQKNIFCRFNEKLYFCRKLDNMKLSVKNLGPIKQGEIDLSKRFSVFVGYNNSGKTYMAQVIWTMFRYLYTSGIFTIPLKMTTTFPQNLHELKKSGFEIQPIPLLRQHRQVQN